jgi:hypothetical protein
MNDERLELIVDNDDTYQDVENVFYINPHRLSMVRCLQDGQFVSCTIKNSPIDCLTSMNFSYILRKLKPNATCEIIIYQPISVMQEYDAKQVEANAKLAGFTDFETSAHAFVDSKTDKKFNTLAVTCIKPVKNPNEIEVEIVVTKKETKGLKGKDQKGKDQNTKDNKKGTTVTTTTTTSYSTTSKKK